MHAACRLQHKREQVMANLKGTNPGNSGDGKTLAVEAKVHRLDLRPSIASERPGTAEGKAPRPENRKPEASPSGEPRGSQVVASIPAPKKSWRRPLMFALLPVALIAGGYFYVTGGAVMSTDNAYVQADMVGLSTDVAGIVTQVLVHDNQKVAKGDILFKLDPLQFQLALDRAEAQVGNTRNDLVALQASYRNMLQGSQQKLASLQQQLAGLAANLNGDPDAPIENHPKYKDAVAARDEAARQLAHTIVRAPFAGIVTNVPSLQPGQYLAAAATAFNIVSTDHVWVQASPKETELTYVKTGQKVTVEVDTFPGQRWAGTVESISPASASSFSLLPAENTSGNWVKVVQRIPMRVRVHNAPGKPALRVGMSVEVSVDTGHERGLPSFITDLFGSSDSEHA